MSKIDMTPYDFYHQKSVELQNVEDNLSQSIDILDWLLGHEGSAPGGEPEVMKNLRDSMKYLRQRVNDEIEAVNVLRDAAEPKDYQGPSKS